MRIQVKAHARSRRESVVKQADGSFKVDVKAPPSDGEANAAICKLLAEYFHDFFSLCEMSFCEYGWHKKIIKRS